MKIVWSALAVLLMAPLASASGISHDCSDAHGSFKFGPAGPLGFVGQVQIRVNGEGKTVVFSQIDEQVRFDFKKNRTLLTKPKASGTETIWFSVVTVVPLNGTQLPDAYSVLKSADGTLTVPVICSETRTSAPRFNGPKAK